MDARICALVRLAHLDGAILRNNEAMAQKPHISSPSGEPPTLKDVAAAAGVSVPTASRAMSGGGDLKNETRSRVLDAARLLGYERGTDPRGRPAAHDPRLIELVLSSRPDTWTEAVTLGARQTAFELGYDLVLTLERDDPDDDWPTRVATRRPAGVVLAIIHPTAGQLSHIRDLRIPVVLLDPRADPIGRLPSVGTTDREGGRDAGLHLVEAGAKRFIVITGSPAYRFGRARESGFREAIGTAAPGAVIDRVESTWTDAVPTPELMTALARGDGPVGVFACNDDMALTVYQAAATLRKEIPRDILVVGFNDGPRAVTASPGLTSVRQPLVRMAGRAVEIIRDLRKHETQEHEREELPTTLIVRGSTG